jgi:hypothetical protein
MLLLAHVDVGARSEVGCLLPTAPGTCGCYGHGNLESDRTMILGYLQYSSWISR